VHGDIGSKILRILKLVTGYESSSILSDRFLPVESPPPFICCLGGGLERRKKICICSRWGKSQYIPVF